jgi:NTE family protein
MSCTPCLVALPPGVRLPLGRAALMTMAMPGSKTALVLGGGGARGAYEAGVIAYLRSELQEEIGEFPIDILCGTSIGAVNASFLAATADTPHQQAAQLVDHWRSVAVEEVLRFDWADVFRLMRDAFGRLPRSLVPEGERRAGLIDPLNLWKPLLSGVPWLQIGRNLRRGLFSALAIGTTHVASGRPVVFLQRADRAAPQLAEDPNFRVVNTRIGPRHVLASGAIPLLFSPVRIEGRLFVDGGLRLNVPLSPALRLGAERLVVVSLRESTPLTLPLPVSEWSTANEQALATAPFLAGKALNALFIENIEQDLDRLRRLNALLEAGEEHWGPQFAGTLNQLLMGSQRTPLRYVRNLLVRPSESIGKLAAEHVRSVRFRKVNTLARRMLRSMAERESPEDADFVSYLLFDRDFADLLIQLGREDARRRRPDWIDFFAQASADAAAS